MSLLTLVKLDLRKWISLRKSRLLIELWKYFSFRAGPLQVDKLLWMQAGQVGIGSQ
jgi:hypothetical protein